MPPLRRTIAVVLWRGQPTSGQLRIWIDAIDEVCRKHGSTSDSFISSKDAKNEVQGVRFDKRDFGILSRCFSLRRLFIRLFQYTGPDGDIDYDRTCKEMISLLGRRMEFEAIGLRIQGIGMRWFRNDDEGLVYLYERWYYRRVKYICSAISEILKEQRQQGYSETCGLD